MQGVAEPRLLIDGSRASTHHFALKPSHMQALNEADLVIWIDRNFESGFQKLPEILPKGTQSLELLRVLGLEQRDGHIWYSPRQLLKIVEHIQLALVRIDPQHASIYSQNAVILSQSIEAWAVTTRRQLASSKPRYLLDHDFLSHFEEDMGTSAIAVLHDSNEKSPGVRELRRIEDQLTRSPALCILVNEPAPARLSQTIAQKYNLPIYSITPTFDASATTGILQSLELLSSILLKCS